jgi:hypothetical protein
MTLSNTAIARMRIDVERRSDRVVPRSVRAVTDDVYDEACRALIQAVQAELGPWMERRILQLAPDRVEGASAVATQATTEVVEGLGVLVATDIDAQRGTPLQLVRRATRLGTAVLRDAGVAPVHRDPWQKEAEPDDDYDLAPATWADIGPESGEAGLVWGAAKAMVHLARHRPPAE